VHNSQSLNLAAGSLNERVQIDVTRLQISLHVVVVVTIPSREDDAVIPRSSEVDDDVVGVRDLSRVKMQLQVLVAAEVHDRRI